MENTLLNQALALPPNERVAFAELILASIEHEDEQIRNIWIEEAKNRIESVKNGKSKLLNFEELYNDD